MSPCRPVWSLVARGKGNKTRAVTVGDETRLALRRYAVMRDSQRGGDALT